MDKFKESFEKVAIKINYTKLFPSAFRKAPKGLVRRGTTRMTGAVKEVAQAPTKARKGHAKYLESIGAFKPSRVEGEVLKYKPSKTKAGLSDFEAITKVPKKA